MRLAVDARPLRHPSSGIGKYTQKILEHLSRERQIELFLYGSAGAPTPTAARVRPTSAATTDLSALLQFGRWSREDRADVFWSPRHHLPLGLGGVPAALTIHDMVWRHYPETMPRGNLLLERLRMPPSVRAAARILVPSEQTRRELVEALAPSAQVSVTPLGGDLLAPAADQHNGPFILFVGGSQPRKNFRGALTAFAEATARLPHRLVVVGPVNPSIVSNVVSGELASRVSFQGNLDEARMAALYRDCAAVFMPSLHEGFGLPVLEAARFGKPSVVSSCGALQEVMGRGGTSADAHDHSGLAQALVALLANETTYADASKAARENSAERTWQATAQATLAVFRELM